MKTAIVTGANRGLGLAACKELCEHGYRVLLCARSQDKAERTVAELDSDAVTPHTLDVASDESVAAFAESLTDAHVLINNAGAIFDGDDSPARVLEAFNNNSLSAYRMMDAVLPLMNAGGYGRIVNVSSGMGSLDDMGGGYAPYRISKTAMNAMTGIFHARASQNVKVNSVCPGWVRTEMGGSSATRSIDRGVSGIIWAATLPDDGPSGGFFRDGKPIAW